MLVYIWSLNRLDKTLLQITFQCELNKHILVYYDDGLKTFFYLCLDYNTPGDFIHHIVQPKLKITSLHLWTF